MKRNYFIIALFAITISASAQITTYFNMKGKEVSTLEKADYYIILQADSTKENRILERKYNKAGQILSEARYFCTTNKVNQRDGLQQEWYENGQLKKKKNYIEGKKDGEMITYAEAGEIINRVRYEKGAERIEIPKDEVIYEVVQKMPEFEGGKGALQSYISTHLKYPESALKKGVQGLGFVLIRFAIKKDGEVSYVHILQSFDDDCDDEAKRVVQTFPRWKPGMQNGVAVQVWYTMPIKFYTK